MVKRDEEIAMRGDIVFLLALASLSGCAAPAMRSATSADGRPGVDVLRDAKMSDVERTQFCSSYGQSLGC
jgi:hypothetical protein